eukprot:CAMPEP_0202833532 /NCGR_PEP_ID=MMETSP1389-20130828/26115_1 /ASSEMBLY_ACC=CAM_ASM_000865 /TAXON_ID=302021 /ORGANISM="Rhodomonas sp., Strain CCMP768" /LENGTH=50 /DNA_ID=CAMNT_0049508239 /DNA_START=106 /DNA_END=255 /DNA_ORIENTATION=-
MASELRRVHLKGTQGFLSLFHPSRTPLKQVVMNRAAWVALDSGTKCLKLL